MTSTTDPSTDLPTSHVLVATGDGLVGGSASTRLTGRQVTAVTSADGGTWALVDRTDLVRITDGGEAETVATLDDGTGVCVHVHRGTIFVGGDDAGLWRLEGGELVPVASWLDAPTRPEWTTPWGGPPSVFSMASSGEDLYVSVHVGGIVRSSDRGETWTATIDLHDDVHQVVAGADGTVWAATGMNGLAQSTDRGATWQHHTEGLHATYLLAVAATDAGVLVGASSGHAGRDGRVYLFDGDRFSPVEGLPDPMDGAVEPRHLAGRDQSAAVVLPDGTVHVSDDGGRSWRQAGGPLPSPAEAHIEAG